MVANTEVIGWQILYICNFWPQRLKIGLLLPFNPNFRICAFVDSRESERGKVLLETANI
jgi:hypothetical protein